MKTKRWIKILGGTLAVAGLVLVRSNTNVPLAHAASTIVVNSTADNEANDGVCTLREAIIAANTDTASGAAAGECIAGSGADTIEFDITGTADYTNNGHNGYTIQPTSQLPDITEQVTVDGYSQPGSSANTVVAPNPIDAVLLIELDGSLANGGAILLRSGSDNSLIKGLVINKFEGSAVDFIGTNSSSAKGNFIGTDPTGQIVRSNGSDDTNSSVAVSIGSVSTATDLTTTGTKVGGLNPEDRNIVSGNYGGAFGVISVDTTIQGNYIGLAADGVTALGNSFGTGVTTGNLTVDYADGLLLGGDQAGAANVISSGSTGGVQPDYSNNIQVIGNLIGTDYTGTLDRGNAHAGVSFAYGTHDSSVRSNTIAYNRVNGVNANSSNHIAIQGNSIHNNGGNGVFLDGPSSNDVVMSNNIYGSTGANLSIRGFSVFGATTDGVVVTGNKIGILPDGFAASNNGIGILIIGDPANVIIGGTATTDRNIISANNGAGISIESSTSSAYGITINAGKVSILGNSIYGNSPASSGPFAAGGLAIDLLEGIDSKQQPNGIADSYTHIGPTLNDAGDVDTGPNNYINFPVLNTATQSGTNLALDYNLDAADSPSNTYRVEFFSNDTANPSGYGEGQTFLGAVTASNGEGNTASLTLPSGMNLTGKVLSATTTAIDNTTTSGFGSTSEFSATLPAVVLAATTVANPSAPNTGLATTGQDSKTPIIFGTFLISAALLTVVARRRYIYRLRR